MIMNFRRYIYGAFCFMAFSISVMLSSCTAEPDESNMYTFTGETVEDFIVNNDSVFSNFHYILKRAGYDRILSAYGTYTCFLPTNKAIDTYIKDLYNDEEAVIPHNGMTEESLNGLSDSLCKNISMYHLAGTIYMTTSLNAAGAIITPLAGPQINTSIVDGKTVLNDLAVVTLNDYEVENGVVHVIDKVIPRSNRLIASELDKDGRFKLFHQALVLTGMIDSLSGLKKSPTKEALPVITPGEDGASSYWVVEEPADIKYTIFAETDSIFMLNEINTIDDLIKKCRIWYENSSKGPETSNQGWYDWYRNEGIEVSTGTDYTNPNNVLNMFVRYHILPYGVAKNSLTIDYCVYDKDGWNGDSYDYYETMLPKTLLKLWLVKKDVKYYINRYVDNNTLTDGIETMGSDAMHTLRYSGVEVDVNTMLSPVNGYIYPIEDILIYDWQVPNGVLNERMRFDALALLPEVMSSGYRGIYARDLVSRSGKNGVSRLRFPVDFFDNLVVYNGNKTLLDMNTLANPESNSFLLYKGDSFQGKGVYDLAIKLPPVPDGMYELRVAATNFGDRGSIMQFYLGESSDVSSMEAIDIPIDLRMSSYLAQDNNGRLIETGYVDINDEANYPDAFADRGVESDKVMRAHNYMRDGLSIVKESDGSTYKPRSMNARYVAYQFRRILIKRDFKQRDYWLRMKTALPKEKDKKYQLDYIELCPVKVYDNGKYMEDMY